MGALDTTDTSIRVGRGQARARSGRPSSELVIQESARSAAREARQSSSGSTSGALATSSTFGNEAVTSSATRTAMAAASGRVSTGTAAGSGRSTVVANLMASSEGFSQTTEIVTQADGTTVEYITTTRVGDGRASTTRRRVFEAREDVTDADAIPRDDLAGLPEEEVVTTLETEAAQEQAEVEAATPAVSTDTPENADSTTSDVAEVFEAEPDPDNPDDLPSVEEVPVQEVVFEEGTTIVVESTPEEPLAGPVPARVDTVVRRPTLGIVGYEDRFCRLEVYAKSLEGGEGDYIPMHNTSYASGQHPINTNFLINQVTLGAEEAVQVVRTFGDYYLSDVGENPRTLSVQGVLIESKNFPWLSEWRANYDHYLRARQCILRKAMAYLTIDDTMYAGYIISSGISRNVTPAWELVPFNFTMILRKATDLRASSLFRNRIIGGSSEEQLSLRQSRRIDGLRESNIGDPDASTLAQVAELVAGEFDDGARLIDPAPLQFAGSMDEAVTRVNIDHLVSVARKINAAKGYDFINLQGLRNGYLSQRRAEFAALGASDPALLQTYGLPSRYEMAVDARRARVQEEYREAVESGIEAARRGLSRVRFR